MLYSCMYALLAALVAPLVVVQSLTQLPLNVLGCEEGFT